MKSVGSREFKNRLGHYLKLVLRGEVVLITDRGKPVAKVTSLPESRHQPESVDHLLERLESEGYLRLARGTPRHVKPARVKGKAGSQLIIEDRR